MQETRATFLGLLHCGDADAWRDFESASKPLLRRWLRSDALSPEDVEDLIQEVMLFVVDHLGEFEHNTRTGAFRKWLRSVAVNIARNHVRKMRRNAAGHEPLALMLDQLEDETSRLSLAFERDYQHALLRQLLRRIEKGFSAETLGIFRQYVLQEASVAETAEAHGVSKAAVYVAKSKVMRRLREAWGEGFEL